MTNQHLNPASEGSGIGKRLTQAIDRRLFLRYSGLTVATTGLLLAGCDDDENGGGNNNNMVNVGTGDVGVLNYAYALEQLEAAFYTQLRTGSYYTGLAANSAEKQILDDLYYHEVIHREFFKAALTAAGATPIKNLEPNFSTVDFNNRGSVLGTAKTFEDLGVAAYNGAGKYLQTPAYLVVAGKIVSVEARHAALIRDLVAEASFVDADVVRINENGLEISKEPSVVVAAANNFLRDGSKLDVSGIR
ncbi:hypothetical protein GCM10027048_31400 [Hymenobacter coalescens]